MNGRIGSPIKPGGLFFVIDNSLAKSDFAGLLHQYGFSSGFDADRRDAFWRGHGFSRETIASEWRASDRQVLEKVLNMEFPLANVGQMMQEITGASMTYYYDVFFIQH